MKTFFTLALLSMLGLTQAQNLKAAQSKVLQEAYFAGGCFWCIEAKFEKILGVHEAVSGYSGGNVEDPSYEQVCTGTTGHREAVKVVYDPETVSYAQLVESFWTMFDPTDPDGSFADRGPQYTSAVLYQTDEERGIAEKSRQKLNQSGRFDRPVATAVEPLKNFYPAEEIHQDYYQKNPFHYESYSFLSGRESFISRHWAHKEQPGNSTPPKWPEYSKPDPEVLQARLSKLQFKVTQKNGTEPAFLNEYWDNKKDGLYVDVASGEPLFSSRDKFDSGTGWPSFTRPLEAEHIVTREDKSLFMSRTEVRSKYADSHLGHVFPDGPEPTGQRYCINSAALRFIPKEDLEKQGYGQYAHLFAE